MLISLIGVGLVINLAKTQIFYDWDRPLAVFGDSDIFHYISPVELTQRAFPSGHSAAAAAMFSFIAFYVDRMRLLSGVAIAILAISVAYSRLYIGVHFFADVVVGTLLGVTIAVGVLVILYKRLAVYFDQLADSKQRIWNIVLYGFLAIALLFDMRLLYLIYNT